jgi:thioesterase domain-containing protein
MEATEGPWALCVEIIADELGVDPEDIQEQDQFSYDLGVNAPLCNSITTRLQKVIPGLPPSILEQYPTVGSLHGYVSRSKGPLKETDLSAAIPARAQVPLSVVLQGNPAESAETIFLLPDGSGSGMAYARIPPIGNEVCLIGMNSPYLRCPSEYRCSIEDMARHWSHEIRRRRPMGPYVVGGWSAGGYYSYEVAQELMRQGERVSKLILLDSPCRPDFEELPIKVVEYLSAKGLMGNLSGVSANVVEHFRSTLCAAVRQYIPTPMAAAPKTFVIWSADGVMEEDQLESTGLDLGVKVSRFLLAGKPNFGPHGWDRLCGGLYTATIPGNHFTLISPPNVSDISENSFHCANFSQVKELGALLGDVVSGELGQWTKYAGAK